MTITIEAVYEDGVLKPKEPLPFKEHEKLHITVQGPFSRLSDLYGLMRFTGTVEEADFFAMDSDLDYPPPPPEEAP